MALVADQKEHSAILMFGNTTKQTHKSANLPSLNFIPTEGTKLAQRTVKRLNGAID
jgi:hypothetical protein